MKLDLDFAPRPPKAGIRLGLVALLLCLVLGIVWGITGNTEAGQPSGQIRQPGAEEIGAINEAIGQLNYPWSALLAHLRTSVDEQSRLEQIEIDVAENRLTLRGEARDSQSVLAILNRLREGFLLGDVRIVSQNPVAAAEAGPYPLSFTLEASLGQGSRP